MSGYTPEEEKELYSADTATVLAAVSAERDYLRLELVNARAIIAGEYSTMPINVGDVLSHTPARPASSIEPSDAQVDAAAKVIAGEHFDILSEQSLRNIRDTAREVLRAAATATGQE